VNHGPDEQGPEGQGLEGLGLGDHGPGGPDADRDPEGLGSDELALRRLLHQAVEEMEPRDGTLDHLRRAVPARRARKRQAVVGMAAAALFIGTAIPALVHVSNSTGSDTNTSPAGNSQETQGSSQGKATSGSGSSNGSGGSSKGTGKDKGKGKENTGKGSGSGGTGPAATASADTAAVCTAAQLSSVTSTVGSPDASGAVYGSFRVTNASGTGCTVAGGGGVSASAEGAADQSKILVTTHVAGDAATGLPDPSLYAPSLELQPGAAYEVRFAWVPSETCPTTEPSPDPSPTDNTGTGGNGGTTTEGGGASAQLFTEDGIADGSVLVSHTVEGGAPSGSTKVGNACAGTIYRTGLLKGA
jgi:hypothetical protein